MWKVRLPGHYNVITIIIIIIVYERLPLSSLNEFYIDHERLPFGALDYYYIAYEWFPLLCWGQRCNLLARHPFYFGDYFDSNPSSET